VLCHFGVVIPPSRSFGETYRRVHRLSVLEEISSRSGVLIFWHFERVYRYYDLFSVFGFGRFALMRACRSWFEGFDPERQRLFEGRW
jgi:hypothetical protein